MTQWWELAIPAIAGVGGALLGAWIQALNSRKLREAQAIEMRTARSEQFQHEIDVLSTEKRIELYVRFMKSVDRKRENERRVERSQQRCRLLEDRPISDPERMAAKQELVQHAIAAKESGEKLTTDMEYLNVLAPQSVISAAANYYSTKDSADEEAARLALDQYLAATRADIARSRTPAI